jgi:hypothetical protein
MESGVNARPRDFARFGLMMLHDGRWDGVVLRPGKYGQTIGVFPDEDVVIVRLTIDAGVDWSAAAGDRHPGRGGVSGHPARRTLEG